MFIEVMKNRIRTIESLLTFSFNFKSIHTVIMKSQQKLKLPTLDVYTLGEVKESSLCGEGEVQ